MGPGLVWVLRSCDYSFNCAEWCRDGPSPRIHVSSYELGVVPSLRDSSYYSSLSPALPCRATIVSSAGLLRRTRCASSSPLGRTICNPRPECSEGELQGQLDGAGAADLIEGAEAAVGAAGAEAAG